MSFSNKSALRKTSVRPSSAVGGNPPRDPNKTITDLIDVIRRLQSVYERETDALENINTNGFLAVQEEKLSAAKEYQSGVETIMLYREEMKGADAALKLELERMQAQFTELSYKNMNALKRMQRTMDRLGNTIRKAAKDEAKKKRAVSYGSNGVLRNDDKKKISMGISETA